MERTHGYLHQCEASRFPGSSATTLRCNLGVYPLARRTGTQAHRSLLFQAHSCRSYSARTLSNRHGYMQVIREQTGIGCATSVFHPHSPRPPPSPPARGSMGGGRMGLANCLAERRGIYLPSIRSQRDPCSLFGGLNRFSASTAGIT